MTTRRALLWLAAFLAVTTILGGIGILLGVLGLDEADLDGSPFGSYVVPGLALLVLVGGTATVAVMLLQQRHPLAPFAAASAGAAMMIFEVVQMRYIPFHILQVVYLIVGAVIVAVAIRDWQTRARSGV